MAAKTGVLLVNLGTPDSPRPRDVFHYLNEFLTDARVIDVPWLWRQLLVRGLIVPSRFRSSAALYQKIWTPQGSPLLVHSREAARLLQEELGEENYRVALGMRYKNPSIRQALSELRTVSHLIVVPLFPQYASATTGSVHQAVMEELKNWQTIPSVTFVNNYATHPLFIEAFAERARDYDRHDFDKIVFSFHGLPERQLRKADQGQHCLSSSCCERPSAANAHCYKAQCYATAKALAARLALPPDRYSISFQSRLGRDPWTQPYTDKTLEDLAKAGCKRVLVFAPAFTADCLETIEEIGQEYAHLFQKCGGEQLQLVESLNAHPAWIRALKEIVEERSQKSEDRSQKFGSRKNAEFAETR